MPPTAPQHAQTDKQESAKVVFQNKSLVCKQSNKINCLLSSLYSPHIETKLFESLIVLISQHIFI